MEERLAVRMDCDLSIAHLIALNIKRRESLLTVWKTSPLCARQINFASGVFLDSGSDRRKDKLRGRASFLFYFILSPFNKVCIAQEGFNQSVCVFQKAIS